VHSPHTHTHSLSLSYHSLTLSLSLFLSLSLSLSLRSVAQYAAHTQRTKELEADRAAFLRHEAVDVANERRDRDQMNVRLASLFVVVVFLFVNFLCLQC
jgi:hypothetical protein